ncbi:type II toxin-antitoxin system antitoxin DNA ADP-ribosyl glycohydrolase DarG [Sphingobacterium luzhongxinii]|uniref:type II toxin-antitoxin system antitoxin DNA ADP-ribosyl glycohydrolase DarG n=1 Tax=Sphingobacterium luzhongxinii TaxID=2654181 RepID=UPI0013DC564F|nr:macro domain-containing protein [Sphingobacterium sp. xlx-73]
MIKFLQGDLMQSDAEALVNTVNTVGVMGKGIALQFKNQYPYNYKVYKEACKKGELKVGEVLVVKDGDILCEKYIINFPTKEHWRSPSEISYIQQGLEALKESIKEYNIKSIAIPPLGCGNGGLDWNIVKPMIIGALGELEIGIYVYEPNVQIKKILQSEKKAISTKLTPGKAMLLYLMFHYESVGDISSLFSANKLAYFLQESGENLKLNFQAHHYGPYAVQVNHVLYSINGVYLRGLEQNQAKAFEPLLLNYDKYQEVEAYVHTQLKQQQRDRISSVLTLIKGFESTYALELLASVDYSRKQEGVNSVEDIKNHIKKWNQRKSNLFKAEHIELAYKHLKEYQSILTI